MTETDVFQELLADPNMRLVTSSGKIPLSVRVEKAVRPYTMSPVFHVSIDKPQDSEHLKALPSNLPDNAIIKLYDRRCIMNDRKHGGYRGLWSLDKEHQYRLYLKQVAEGIIKPVSVDDYYEVEDDPTAGGGFEYYLKCQAHKMFSAEHTTYMRLSPLQGKEVPRLYGVIECDLRIDLGEDRGGVVTEIVPGLLLEYIPSMTIRQLVKTWTSRADALPNEVLAKICETAVEVIDHINDLEVLNEDVRIDNILTRDPFLVPRPEASAVYSGDTTPWTLVEHPVVVIDFAQCRLRQPHETEAQWGHAKWMEDEMGAAGFVLASKVKACW